jgi:hypothetical protein
MSNIRGMRDFNNPENRPLISNGDQGGFVRLYQYLTFYNG